MNPTQFRQEFGQLLDSLRGKNPVQIMQSLPSVQQQILAKHPNMNPQQMVNQIMQSGAVPQAEFEKIRHTMSMFGMKL